MIDRNEDRAETHEIPMDCQTARQIVEAVRSGSTEETLSVVSAAADHVQSCGTCLEIVRSDEQLDRRIATVCRDVPMPVGLKDRLLESLRNEIAESETSTPATVHDSQALVIADMRRRLGRRKWFRSLTSAAFLLVIGLGVWWLVRDTATVTLDAIDAAQAALNPEDLPEFTRFKTGDEPRLPQMLALPEQLTAKPRRLQVGRDALALYAFQIRSRNGRNLLHARIVTFPRAMLSSAPENLAHGRQIGYVDNFHTASWIEQDMVYVCYLTGGRNELEWLLRRLETT